MDSAHIEKIILGGAYSQLEILTRPEFKNVSTGRGMLRSRGAMLLVRQFSEAKQNIGLYRPAEWLGRPLTGSERVQFCKKLRRLGEDGLLVRLVDARGRTTHIQLTKAGLRAAKLHVGLSAETSQ